MAEKEKLQEIDENHYMHEAIDKIYSLCDSGEIDFKYKADAISYMINKIRERIEYINYGLKNDMRSELMEYDPRDDTSHIFDKYKALKEKLIDEIDYFDMEDFKEYMLDKKI